MSWTPITGTPFQYHTGANELAVDYYLKMYLSGPALTPYSMATDSTGDSTLAKCKIGSEGYPISNPLDETTVFIPHVEVSYRLVMYANEADADSNNTSAAAFNVDGIDPDIAQLASIIDITTKGTTLQAQDDYDRSPLFIDVTDFTAGAGPHEITVPDDWTPTNSDMRFYKLSASGIISTLTPTLTTSTTFTIADTLATDDTLFIGDDEFREQFSGHYLGSASLVDVGRGDNQVSTNDLLQSYWWLSAAEYSGDSFDFSAATGGSLTSEIAFSEDGSLFFVNGIITDLIYSLDLSTAWDVTTASYSGVSFSYSGQTEAASCFTFSADGLHLSIASGLSDSIYAYDLSAAWDITTASYSGVYDVSAESTNPEALDFSVDGTRLFVNDATGDIYYYSLSTAWDISTASYSGDSLSVSGDNGLVFNSSGLQFITVGSSGDAAYLYQLGKAWDITTASLRHTLDVLSNTEDPVGVAVSNATGQIYFSGQGVSTGGIVFSYRFPSLLQNA